MKRNKRGRIKKLAGMSSDGFILNSLCDVCCLWYGSYISGSSPGGGGFLLLMLYLLLALLIQLFSLPFTLLVGPLSHLHCVFSDSPLCSLIFLVLWCSMFTVVFIVFLFLFCLSYLFNFSFHPKKS